MSPECEWVNSMGYSRPMHSLESIAYGPPMASVVSVVSVAATLVVDADASTLVFFAAPDVTAVAQQLSFLLYI